MDWTHSVRYEWKGPHAWVLHGCFPEFFFLQKYAKNACFSTLANGRIFTALWFEYIVENNHLSKSWKLSPSIYNPLASGHDRKPKWKLGRITERAWMLACLSQLAHGPVFVGTSVFFFFLAKLWSKQVTWGLLSETKGWRFCFKIWLRSLLSATREAPHVSSWSIASRRCGLSSTLLN